MKKTRPNPRANKNILWFAYGVVGVFAAMGLYMGAFLQFRSEDVINNPYNARIAGMADRVVRGKLLADDGTVIAETVVGEDGKETRSYLTENCLPMWPVIPPWKDRTGIPGEFPSSKLSCEPYGKDHR